MSEHMLRPDAKAVLDVLSSSPLSRLDELGAEEGRAISREMLKVPDEAPSIDVRNLSFTHSGVEIGLRCFNAMNRGAPTAVILYFHGGGFVIGDLDSHHELCLAIASGTGLPLVSVDYRLAPENPWPAAPDDTEAAARWLAKNASDVLGIELSGIILAGDSAGANLVGVTARALRDDPCDVPLIAQFLLFPWICVDRTTHSMHEYGEGYFLTFKSLEWCEAQYAPPLDDPRYNLLAFDQAGMPPTLLVTAGMDPLRDEGRAYAARLIEAGVPVTYQEVTGNIHGCFSLVGAIPSTQEDIDRAFAALSALASRNPCGKWAELGVTHAAIGHDQRSFV